MLEILAEAGVNHGGDVNIAVRMVDAAAEAGANAIKFQTYSPEHAISKQHPNYDLLAKLALSHHDFVRIARYCQLVGIEFLSTPGDLISLKFLVDELGVKRLKIGSDDLTYMPLLEAAAATKLPLILSTGMATETDILDALRVCSDTQDITLLHCVSCYPCANVDVNLKAMDTLRKFGYPVGYSDHTKGTLACLAAAARGAEVIEKHFMMARHEAVDSAVSIDENQLFDMIQRVRIIESMLGSGVKVPCAAELKNKALFIKDSSGLKRGVAV